MTRSTQQPSEGHAVSVHPIRSEADYERALAEIERLFEALPGTPEGDELDVLTTLVEAYEARHHPILPPDPVEALIYYLESHGLTRRELEPYLGSRARVAEVLNRRRGLSIEMIRRLSLGLGLPAEILIRPYPLASRGRRPVTASNTVPPDAAPA